MSRAVGGEGSVAEPNLTPLLDVVLQLLMFFMMCVNFVNEQVNEEIRLPKSQSVKPMDKADTDVLYVNFKPFLLKDFQDRLPADVLARVQNRFRDGDQCILIPGKEPMRRSDFKVWLKEQYEDAKKIAEARPNGPKDVNTAVVIRAHQDADYNHVFEVLQMCKTVGYTRLKLRAMTKNNPGGGS
jgi:biopolymer transport protein ExbD